MASPLAVGGTRQSGAPVRTQNGNTVITYYILNYFINFKFNNNIFINDLFNN